MEPADLPDDRLDEILAVLSIARRRDILRILGEQSAPMAITDVVRKLDQSDEPVTGESSRVVTDDLLTLRLYHVDLPKLRQAGLVEHDTDRKTVQLTDQARCEWVQTIIERPRAGEDSG